MLSLRTLFCSSGLALSLGGCGAATAPEEGAVDEAPLGTDGKADTAPPRRVIPAAPCSAEFVDRVRGISRPDEKEVAVTCSLTLPAGLRIEKRLVLQGSDASGVTVDCNGSTLDGGPGTRNDGKEMLLIRSTRGDSTGGWSRPVDVTVKDCSIVGAMRIYGMGRNGEDGMVHDSSRRDTAHVARVRAAAPTRVLLDNLTITATHDTPLYLSPGVTLVTLQRSELKGNAVRTAIYLDAESAYNVIRNNYIHVSIFDEWHIPYLDLNTRINRIGPQVSVDTSSYNKIYGNRFSGLVGGGVFTYRNCGEGGTIRHGTPSYNEIINNVFYYNLSDGDVPAVYLGAHEVKAPVWCQQDVSTSLFVGSAISELDKSSHNVVMQNQIYKLPTSKMIKVGAIGNVGNIIEGNQTVTTAVTRRSGCYVEDGYKNFLRDGASLDVFKDVRDRPVCGATSQTCTDGELSFATVSGCVVQSVPFDCPMSGSDAGCSRTPRCPTGTHIVGAKAACNLESATVTDAELASVANGTLGVTRASDVVAEGSCTLAATTLRSGAAPVEAALDRVAVTASCKEHDSNGGDCNIRGILYCR